MRDILGDIVPEYSLVSDDDFFIAGYRKIKGIHITSERFDGKPLGRHPAGLKEFHGKIASELADVLNILHSEATEKEMTAVEGIPYETDLKGKYEKLHSMVNNSIFPLIAENVRNNISSSFRTFLDKFDLLGFKPKFIHGDFGGWNIIFNESDMDIAGVIDWSSSRIGDPALDFSELLYDFGPEIMSKVKEIYLHETDQWFWDRVYFYLSLEGFLDFFESGSQELIKRGLKRIVENFSGK